MLTLNKFWFAGQRIADSVTVGGKLHGYVKISIVPTDTEGAALGIDLEFATLAKMREFINLVDVMCQGLEKSAKRKKAAAGRQRIRRAHR